MDGPSRNLDKGNSSSKKKGKQWAAFGCSNTFYGPNGLPTSLHFFKFPKDTNRRRRWCNLIKRQHGKDGFFVTNSTVVCSEHFRKEDIRKTLTGRWELVSVCFQKTIFIYHKIFADYPNFDVTTTLFLLDIMFISCSISTYISMKYMNKGHQYYKT